MKKRLPTGILAASIVAACVVSHGQNFVYSLNIGSPVNLTGDALIYLKGWDSGSSTNSFGFDECQKVHYPEYLNGDPPKIPYPTQTTLYYGTHTLSFQARAWQVGLAASLVALLSIWLAFGLYTRQRE